MKERIENLVAKAHRSLKAAKKLLTGGDYDFSISRLYYAMFYIAEAMLLAKRKEFSSHHSVIAEFGKTFAKTGVVDPKFHKWLSSAFKSRQKSDYWEAFEVTREEAVEITKRTEEFLRMGIAFLRKEFPSEREEKSRVEGENSFSRDRDT